MTLFAWAGCGELTGPDLDGLRTAPTEATVDGTRFHLRLSIGKNSSVPQLLLSSTFVIQPDSLPVPESISVERLWVVNGDRIWEPEEVTEKEEHFGECPHERLFLAHADGSEVVLDEWKRGEQAFSVIQLSSREGNQVLLRSPPSEILHFRQVTCSGGTSG